MVNALDSGSSGPVSGPGQETGNCVVSFGKTLYSHSASLHQGVSIPANFLLRVTCRKSTNDVVMTEGTVLIQSHGGWPTRNPSIFLVRLV